MSLRQAWFPPNAGDELRERGLGEDADEGLVVTQEVTRSLAVVAPWLKAQEPFILVGQKQHKTQERGAFCWGPHHRYTLGGFPLNALVLGTTFFIAILGSTLPK